MEDPDDEIKVKQEYPDDDEDNEFEHSTATESSELHGIADDLKKSIMTRKTGAKSFPCSMCKLSFSSKHKIRYHKVG